MRERFPKPSCRSLDELLVAGARAHFVGIGGVGMSGLAQALLARGCQVSGSDVADSETTARLQRLGAAIFIGHGEENIGAADLVVYSDAVAPDNPELLFARARGIPVVRRSVLLGALTARLHTIAIAGTHGKTTTAAMVVAILSAAGLSPTMFLGGEYPPLGGNVCIGKGEWAVVEACEAFSSFLDLSPEIAVVTNIEAEHLDYHGSEEALRGAFRHFLQQVKPEGTVVVCADEPGLLALVNRAGTKKLVDYGLRTKASFQATEIAACGPGSEFLVLERGQPWARVKLQIPGKHNISNALAALAVAVVVGIEPTLAAFALGGFRGVKRRLEVIAQANGITVVDDYAHHPTEIQAVFSALKEHSSGRLLAVFQPHLYSRTKFFLRDFARALSGADLAWVTDIYPAREAPIPGVEASKIAAVAREEFAGKVEYLSFEAVVTAVMQQLQEGDIVITMGAGNVDRIARSLAEALSANFHSQH